MADATTAGITDLTLPYVSFPDGPPRSSTSADQTTRRGHPCAYDEVSEIGPGPTVPVIAIDRNYPTYFPIADQRTPRRNCR